MSAMSDVQSLMQTPLYPSEVDTENRGYAQVLSTVHPRDMPKRGYVGACA
jgi:hypothetical protein